VALDRSLRALQLMGSHLRRVSIEEEARLLRKDTGSFAPLGESLAASGHVYLRQGHESRHRMRRLSTQSLLCRHTGFWYSRLDSKRGESLRVPCQPQHPRGSFVTL
jgi:hypothetical protein